MDKSIVPKVTNLKRPINPDAKISGFAAHGYLVIHSSVLTFPQRPQLTDTTTDAEYVTAIVPVGANNKPFGLTKFAKVEVIPNMTEFDGKGDFASHTTNVESTATVVFYGDKDSVGLTAKLRGADVHLILPDLSGELRWLGDKDIPATVLNYEESNKTDEKRIKLTISFKPLPALYLPATSTFDLIE